MDFAHSPETEELRQRLLTFMDEHVHPAEAVLQQQLAERENPWTRAPVVRELQAEARKRGLWNLFLAGHPNTAACPTCGTPRWPRSPDAAPSWPRSLSTAPHRTRATWRC